ncbi:T-cell receptor beta variable region [Anopheles sinensis]|uniref:T-cell receptor beta variable region n=1 Tax=Anopheles sinensis TaxID=74873 RepID=A0A084WHT3_ANOSI|nr:T-cell receptor beta variable region [Anopheles sinensis]
MGRSIMAAIGTIAGVRDRPTFRDDAEQQLRMSREVSMNAVLIEIRSILRGECIASFESYVKHQAPPSESVTSWLENATTSHT